MSASDFDSNQPHDICTHCGSPVEPFTWKCPRCGAALNQKSAAPDRPKPVSSNPYGSLALMLLYLFLPGPFDYALWSTTRQQLLPHILAWVILGGLLSIGSYIYIRHTMPTVHFPEVILFIYAVAAAFALWVFYPMEEEG
ncbi:MAG: hypothetical protein KGN79_11730 [Acidobacteriota bacterium]|nr:hypothetical protein [Acidobacteriota bacterium]